MCFLHAATVVLAWSAGRLADLVDEHFSQPGHVGPEEFQVDAVVFCHRVPEPFHNRGDRVDPSKSLEQRPFHDSSPTESRSGTRDVRPVPPTIRPHGQAVNSAPDWKGWCGHEEIRLVARAGLRPMLVIKTIRLGGQVCAKAAFDWR